MSSVKRIKSKSKGHYGVAGRDHPYDAYGYRRCAFADEPPILVRPLRTIKAWAAEAARDLNEKLTAMMASNPNASFTEVGQQLRSEFAEVRRRTQSLQLAEKLGRRGEGRALRWLAGTVA